MTAKEAAIKAKEYLTELLGGEPVGVKLEEVEIQEDRWFITLSYIESLGTPDDILNGTIKRVYKIFEIQDSNGVVVSMKIRKL